MAAEASFFFCGQGPAGTVKFENRKAAETRFARPRKGPARWMRRPCFPPSSALSAARSCDGMRVRSAQRLAGQESHGRSGAPHAAHGRQRRRTAAARMSSKDEPTFSSYRTACQRSHRTNPADYRAARYSKRLLGTYLDARDAPRTRRRLPLPAPGLEHCVDGCSASAADLPPVRQPAHNGTRDDAISALYHLAF